MATLSTPTKASLFSRIVGIREVPIVLVLVLICIGTSLVQNNFLSQANLRSILMWMPLVIIVAMGEMMVLITRGVDVSVGSMMGLAAMRVGVMFQNHTIESVPLAIAIAIGIGMGLGAINGLLITLGRVPPIVATLGTMGVFRGYAYIVSDSKQVENFNIPERLTNWTNFGPFGQNTVPWLVIIAIVFAVGAFLFLRYTVTGRNIYAVGGNPEAARLRGVPVQRVIFLTYVIAGACSGLAGILYASRFGTLNPQAVGNGFELVVISAVVVGGVSVFGGAGTVSGVLLGTLLLGTIYTALTVMNVADAWQGTAYGIVILLAVIFDDLIAKRKAI